MMELLNKAAVLNSMGAHMLEVQNTSGAIQAFEQAIHLVRECLQRQLSASCMMMMTTTTMDQADDRVITMNDMLLYQSLHGIPTIETETGATIPATASRSSSSHPHCNGSYASGHSANGGPSKKFDIKSSNEEYFVHDRALLLPNISYDVHVDGIVQTTSIVIMYNYCISCYQLGKRTCQTAIVMQALQVYEILVGVILQQLDESTTDVPFLRVVLCLTLNNMAGIHCDFCDYDNLENCVDFCQLTIGRHSETIDMIAWQFIPPAEWNEVKLNALFTKSPSTAGAA